MLYMTLSVRGGMTKEEAIMDLQKTSQVAEENIKTDFTHHERPPLAEKEPPNNTNLTPTNITSTSTALPSWRARLPKHLRTKRALKLLTLGQTDIYLLGTAHVSNNSCQDVKLLLEFVHPDVIFVELCEGRIALLDSGVGNGHQQPSPASGAANETNFSGVNSSISTIDDDQTKISFWHKVRQTQHEQGGSRLQALSTVLLTSMQEDYAEELGVELGGEFQCAHRYWKEQTQFPPHLVLGDRPLQLTLIRAWESLRWWPKLKLIVGMGFHSLFVKPNKDELKKWLESILSDDSSDLLTESLKELQRHFPSLHETIIAERDAWLAAKLVQTCRAIQSSVPMDPHNSQQRSTLVAIVGAGHVPGICQWLTSNHNERSPEEILTEFAQTRKWQNDAAVQREAIPRWVNEVTMLQEPGY